MLADDEYSRHRQARYSPYGTLLGSTETDTNPFRYGGQAGYYTDTNNPTETILYGLR